MPKSLQHVLSQIDKLQKEADSLRAKEVSGVVARIREANAHYNLTPQQLFGRAGRNGRADGRAGTTERRPGTSKPKGKPDARAQAFGRHDAR